MPRTLGNLTRYHRKKLGYTQAHFANMLGMSIKNLSLSERDKRPLTMVEADGLCQLAGLKADDIVAGAEATKAARRKR